MPFPRVTTSDQPPEQQPCDVLMVGATASGDGIVLSEAARACDRSLDGLLSGSVDDGFKGALGDTFGVPTRQSLPARWVYLVGLGSSESITPDSFRHAAANSTRQLRDRTEIAVALASEADGEEALEASVEGAILGTYRFGGYPSGTSDESQRSQIFLTSAGAAVDRASARAGATWLARDLVNEPASVLTPTEFARRSAAIADEAGLTCEVIDGAELERRGFGGLVAVAQGSDEPPQLVILRYEPDDAVGDVAVIGKGITFDSGGYSIKPAASMEQMKTDMGGAAAVLGAMASLGRLGVRVRVTGYLAIAENMVSASAMRPGDVITHYGGRTTEVVNTDAEGRLVLADALALASEHGPDAIVDVATLTGTIHLALGPYVSGLYYNDDDMRDELEDAGRAAGEPLWRMPIVEGYRSQLDSDVADQRNRGSRYGGASTAALFLREFVGGTPWAHLDIAGTGRAASDRYDVTKGGTGTAARTLLRWLEARSARA